MVDVEKTSFFLFKVSVCFFNFCINIVFDTNLLDFRIVEMELVFVEDDPADISSLDVAFQYHGEDSFAVIDEGSFVEDGIADEVT